MQDSIHSICVCGAGTMGSGIAQVAAQSGFHTVLYDVNAAVLSLAKSGIKNNLQSLQNKNKLSSIESNNILSRLLFTGDMNDCIADIFIEAIAEQMELKVGLFNRLNEFNHSEVIFATNTSSLSVAAIAQKVMHPERLVGMHFFNPAPIMKLVEVVRTSQSKTEAVQIVYDLAKLMGKIPVICNDAPGFIVNHVARPFYLEALKLVELGISDIATIDVLMESTGFKMGPFKLMDLIGNDINYTVSRSVYEALGKPERLEPSPLQQIKVENGQLGRKTGQGYYSY